MTRASIQRLAWATSIVLAVTAHLAAEEFREVHPYWNLQWGEPQRASAGFGVLIGRIDQGAPGEHPLKHALHVEVRPGIDGLAFQVGYAPFELYMARWKTTGAGVAVKGTILRTWRDSKEFGPNETYAGAELHVQFAVKGSIGVLWRVSSGTGKSPLLTWGVGIGL